MSFPWQTRSGRYSPLKAATLAACILPGVLIAGWYFSGQLGALPTKSALHLLGLWSIRFLLMTLALTPLQRLLFWPQLAQVRRMAGTTAAGYAVLHLALFLPFMGFSFSKIASEVLLRPYLTIGAMAFLLLMILAATSTDRQIAKLGARWKSLHRAIYILIPLVLLHMALQEKIDATAPLQLAGLYLLMMALRLQNHWRPLALVAAILAVAGATACGEATWYSLHSGISGWRVLAANLNFDNGLRPAQLTLIAGLAVTAAAVLRHRGRQMRAIASLSS